jgi:ATP-binding cassette subfamily F protein 3
VLVAEDVMLSVGGRTLLAGFSARVQRGEVIGVIGANGAGKSTLLRAIAGERPVDGGQLRLPESVRIAYYRQDLAQVPPDETLYDIIGHLRPHWGRGAIQSHLGRFGFSGDTVQRRAGSLSGGERARVALAMMMLSGANLLLFDEPTNHLDVESIEALEDAIEAFGGTVLVVSHDRALLRGLTTRVWVLAHGRIREYPGSFDEWEASERERERKGRASAPDPAATMRATPRRLGSQVVTGRSERQRGAATAVEEAEAVVETWENRVRRLRDALEDPQLYETGEGARRATEIVRELAAARERLEEAFAAWGALLSDFE